MVRPKERSVWQESVFDKRRRPRLLVVALVAIALLVVALLAACDAGSSSTDTTPRPSESGPNGIVGKGGGDVPWEQLANKAKTGGAEAAISWAESFEAGHENAGTSSQYAGLCLEFVANAYGASYSNPYNTAWEMGSSLNLSNTNDPTAAPRGALMFFDLTAQGIPEGHVGLSLGGGNLLSALPHSSPGTTNVMVFNVNSSSYWRSTYRGWAWPIASWGVLAVQANGSSNSGTSTSGDQTPNIKGFSETPGGVTHTWSDYVHAGGQQGQSIAAYQTVLVSCKLTGWKAPDGNPWWYRIASSPWNNNYYASADAFYNNGHISGSLLNTPWVDDGVATCYQSAPTPIPTPPPAHPTATPVHPTATPVRPTATPKKVPTAPTVTPTVTPTPTPRPPATHAEIAGPGGANTFTYYQNAGAPFGQHIAAYQTIQVSCRLTGWTAPDGNNWWYRVASSPWNNAFYVTADNFYNNGQSSGSLLNTPFVDTNVPMC